MNAEQFAHWLNGVAATVEVVSLDARPGANVWKLIRRKLAAVLDEGGPVDPFAIVPGRVEWVKENATTYPENAPKGDPGAKSVWHGPLKSLNLGQPTSIKWGTARPIRDGESLSFDVKVSAADAMDGKDVEAPDPFEDAMATADQSARNRAIADTLERAGMWPSRKEVRDFHEAVDAINAAPKWVRVKDDNTPRFVPVNPWCAPPCVTAPTTQTVRASDLNEPAELRATGHVGSCHPSPTCLCANCQTFRLRHYGHPRAWTQEELDCGRREASANRSNSAPTPADVSGEPRAFSFWAAPGPMMADKLEPATPLLEPPSGLHLSHCTCSLCERPTHPVETCPCWTCASRRQELYGDRRMMTMDEVPAAFDRLRAEGRLSTTKPEPLSWPIPKTAGRDRQPVTIPAGATIKGAWVTETGVELDLELADPEPHDGNVAGPFRRFGWRRR